MLMPPKTITVTRDQLCDHAHPLIEVGLIFVHAFPALQKAIVFDSKLFPFRLFIDKGLHHPDAGQCILHLGVDIANALPVPFEGDIQIRLLK